jgi:ubiquinone/menaquinone biosynthesis C-methylase UbiE
MRSYLPEQSTLTLPPVIKRTILSDRFEGAATMTHAVDDRLRSMYENYYGDSELERKRRITAEMTISHVTALTGWGPLGSVVDVGAGQGSFVELLSNAGLARKITALEISLTGIEAISERNLKGVEVLKFDGYTMPGADKEFDLAVSIHVLEHVEHERAFLKEIKRIARRAIIEVPLELTVDMKRKIPISRANGHINLYTATTFRNLLETSGLVVTQLQLHDTTLAYEKHMSPRFGVLKHAVRRACFTLLPAVAQMRFTYLATALCDCG